MLRTADEIGLPTDDDPFAITCWQEYLETKTRYLPKTAKNALERDVTGFYVRTFLSAVSTAIVQEPNSVAAHVNGNPSAELVPGWRGEWRSKLSIARLMLRDDAVSIELPSGEGQEWSITVDGHRVIHLGDAKMNDPVPVNGDRPFLAFAGRKLDADSIVAQHEPRDAKLRPPFASPAGMSSRRWISVDMSPATEFGSCTIAVLTALRKVRT